MCHDTALSPYLRCFSTHDTHMNAPRPWPETKFAVQVDEYIPKNHMYLCEVSTSVYSHRITPTNGTALINHTLQSHNLIEEATGALAITINATAEAYGLRQCNRNLHAEAQGTHAKPINAPAEAQGSHAVPTHNPEHKHRVHLRSPKLQSCRGIGYACGAQSRSTCRGIGYAYTAHQRNCRGIGSACSAQSQSSCRGIGCVC